jgi:nucleoside triphosphate pyrophosphatase
VSQSVVLASASPRRRQLLAAIGLAFDVVPADIDEPAIAGGHEPATGAAAVAVAKARTVAERRWSSIVLAADTIVVLDGTVLGKPRNRLAARAMLWSLRSRTHAVFTAVCVSWPAGEAAATVHSAVHMRPYGSDEIERYVATDAGLDKAGGYGVQDESFQPVASIDGCWCNVMGLPLWTVARLLARADAFPRQRPDQAFERCARCPLAR